MAFSFQNLFISSKAVRNYPREITHSHSIPINNPNVFNLVEQLKAISTSYFSFVAIRTSNSFLLSLFLLPLHQFPSWTCKESSNTVLTDFQPENYKPREYDLQQQLNLNDSSEKMFFRASRRTCNMQECLRSTEQLDFQAGESAAKKVITKCETEKFFSFSVDASNSWGKLVVMLKYEVGVFASQQAEFVRETSPSDAPAKHPPWENCRIRALDAVEIALKQPERSGRERENESRTLWKQTKVFLKKSEMKIWRIDRKVSLAVMYQS